MEILTLLKNTPLFRGVEEAHIPPLLEALDARRERCAAGEAILWQGSEVTRLGVLLTGKGRAVKEDPSGRQLLVTLLGPGSVFGDVLAASAYGSPVTVLADTAAEALRIPVEGILSPAAPCPGHPTLLRNYISVISQKYFALYERIDCLICPSVREKILTYLRRAAREAGENPFNIPLDRAAMAEYLGVERSALSRELSRMKRDGLIDYRRNWFYLI